MLAFGAMPGRFLLSPCNTNVKFTLSRVHIMQEDINSCGWENVL